MLLKLVYFRVFDGFPYIIIFQGKYVTGDDYLFITLNRKAVVIASLKLLQLGSFICRLLGFFLSRDLQELYKDFGSHPRLNSTLYVFGQTSESVRRAQQK